MKIRYKYNNYYVIFLYSTCINSSKQSSFIMYPPRPLFGSPVPLTVVSVKSGIVNVSLSAWVVLGLNFWVEPILASIVVVPGVASIVVAPSVTLVAA